LGLFIAVLAASWASIFIRWCEDTPSLILSFYRMLWSTLLFAFLFFRQPQEVRKSALSHKQRWFIFAAGFLLAMHFITWIASLKLTTVAHSLTLESTHPVFAVILSPFLLKEKAGWRSVVAVLSTFVGILIIGGQDLRLSETQSFAEQFFSRDFFARQFFGDILAVSSALFLTLYLFIARFLRANINLVSYLVRVYGAAAGVLLMINIGAGYPLVDYPFKVHLFMLLLALIPTGIGHSLLNWAARRIEAYKVSLAALGEPVLASIMAYFFFQEVPYGWFYAGAVFILLGIVMAMGERRSV
jgi:drug/metabolite transporter (DMT)-like permease